MKFIWASKIRIGYYREGFVHSMPDGCSCPLEVSMDLKSFIVGQGEACANQRPVHIILWLQKANCFAMSHFHLLSNLI